MPATIIKSRRRNIKTSVYTVLSARLKAASFRCTPARKPPPVRASPSPKSEMSAPYGTLVFYIFPCYSAFSPFFGVVRPFSLFFEDIRRFSRISRFTLSAFLRKLRHRLEGKRVFRGRPPFGEDQPVRRPIAADVQRHPGSVATVGRFFTGTESSAGASSACSSSAESTNFSVSPSRERVPFPATR